MGSAVGRAVSAMDHLRGIRRGTTLRHGSVTPIDGNKFVQRECKKLEKKLPGKMVEMKLGFFFVWKVFGVIRRYNDNMKSYLLCICIYMDIIYTDASIICMTLFLLVGVASCAYAGFQFDVI